MRKLSHFLNDETAKAARILERVGCADPEIAALEYDSRAVKPGALYFALPGLHADGHAFIADALERGAACIASEKSFEECAEIADWTFAAPDFAAGGKYAGRVFIQVENSRFAMSPVAAAFNGFPAERLTVVGVTGTEGKSTTVFLIWQLLRLAGKKAGFISTVQFSLGGEACDNPEHQTTPEATAIHAKLAAMLDAGCEYAVVEASSHGLSPRTNRLGDVPFSAAVMTNVAHEHLEFHGTWEQYREDKANLFRALDKFPGKRRFPNPFGVINADDKSAAFFTSATRRKVYTYSTVAGAGAAADLNILSLSAGEGGNCYTASIGQAGETAEIKDALPGAFNAGNVLASLLAVSHLLGTKSADLVPLVPKLKPVRGRMSRVEKGQQFEVLIDYAHTPSSFRTIFPPLRERADRNGSRLIAVFGSGGERDVKKRPEQGKAAAEWCDIVVLCDEDPRGEEPLHILEEIAAGCEGWQGGPRLKRGEELFLVPERPEAIRKAFALAKPGDIVLLLGKGHENSIIYKDRAIKYDEIAEAEAALLSTAEEHI